MKNKKTLLKVEETLLALGMNPVEEIIECLGRLKPAQRIEVWFDLYKFIEAPRKAGESPSPPMSPVTSLDMDPAALLSLVKP